MFQAVSLSTAGERGLCACRLWLGLSWRHAGLGLGGGHSLVSDLRACAGVGVGRQLASASPLSCQSCYEHIQKDDMHRLPSRRDSGEPW